MCFSFAGRLHCHSLVQDFPPGRKPQKVINMTVCVLCSENTESSLCNFPDMYSFVGILIQKMTDDKVLAIHTVVCLSKATVWPGVTGLHFAVSFSFLYLF